MFNPTKTYLLEHLDCQNAFVARDNMYEGFQPPAGTTGAKLNGRRANEKGKKEGKKNFGILVSL